MNKFNKVVIGGLLAFALGFGLTTNAQALEDLMGDIGRLKTTTPASGDFLPFRDVSNKGDLGKATITNIVDAAGTQASQSITALTTGTIVDTIAPTADSATTNKGISVALTAPIDTTGTNTHTAYNTAITVSNATGGTNTVNGWNFANYTGDAQVDVNAINIGTSDGLGTANAIKIGTGWDFGITTASPTTNTYAAGADSAATNNNSKIALTTPIDTTGTNTHNMLDLALTTTNATGGTNTINGIKFENYTGDAQDNVNAINIGTSDGLGTANAIKIGTGWDAGIVTDSGVQINSTNGTAITAFRFAFDAVASGQTSKTVTVTGATASSRCVASAAEVPSNAVYIKSVAPGTDQVVVTTSGDPGASNLDLTVICLN